MSRAAFELGPPVLVGKHVSTAGSIRAFLELGKARLSALVVLTTVAGFVLASGADVRWLQLLMTVLGTGLAALGANALNQWREVEPDGRMPRTCRRPLPAGRLRPGAALGFGLIAGIGGPVILAVRVNSVTAGLALLALGLYVLLYTPLKRRTAGNTLVGALVGALPPMIGWAAARGTLAPGAWILAAILFLWQIPHFLALAWLYRDDYARGGFRMLPSVDPSGSLTGYAAVVYTLLLWQATIVLALAGVVGWWYLAAAEGLGGALLLAAVGLERQRTNAAARRLFIASIVYLPLLLTCMLLDRQGGGLWA